QPPAAEDLAVAGEAEDVDQLEGDACAGGSEPEERPGMGAPGGESRDDPVVGADEVLDLEPEVGASAEHERVRVRDRLRVVPAEAAVVDGVGRAEARDGAAGGGVRAVARRGA